MLVFALKEPVLLLFVSSFTLQVAFLYVVLFYESNVFSFSGRATRQRSMDFSIRRSVPTRPAWDNTFWDVDVSTFHWKVEQNGGGGGNFFFNLECRLNGR